MRPKRVGVLIWEVGDAHREYELASIPGELGALVGPTEHQDKAAKSLGVVLVFVKRDAFGIQISENPEQALEVSDRCAAIAHSCNLTSAMTRTDRRAKRR